MKKKTKNSKKRKFKFNFKILNILVPILSIIAVLILHFRLGMSIKKLIPLCIIANFIYFSIYLIINKKFKTLLLIMLICFIMGVIAFITFFSYVIMKAPDFDETLLYVTDPSTVLDKNGKEVAKLGNEKRVTITYDEVPEVLIDAIVATEDSRFFEHNGVDLARFLKASFYQLLGKSGAGGASTLTMQLSKNNYTSKKDEGIEGIIRKFTDVYVSMFKIEKKYTKEQIFEFYINSQYLGKQAYGVEQVSLNYFGKSAKELNLAEAAMIAGLFQAPGRYDPYTNEEATENRRQLVLKLMLRHGYITEDEYKIAKAMTVDKIVIPREQNNYISSGVSPYQSFIDTVVEEVQEKTGANPYTTPMTIYTTMDTSVQEYVDSIMDGSSFNWENEKVQAGIAIVSVKDGSIIALGGNRNINAIDTFNYATDIENQIGSTAKPLYDYGPAIEFNNWSPAQSIVDEPSSYSDGTKIGNVDGKYQGFETIRTALEYSRNIPALKTFKQNNKSNVIKFVENIGLTPEIYSCKSGYKLKDKKCINKSDANDIIDATKSNTLHEAHAIGGYNGQAPIDMAAAYAAFGNYGTYTEPYSFTKLVYKESGEEFTNDIKKTKAMSEETAYIICDMLTSTAKVALGRNAEANGAVLGAKTGTTNYSYEKLESKGLQNTNAVNDLWVIGLNPEYSIGIWYGYDTLYKDYYNKVNTREHHRIFNALAKKVFTNKSGWNKPSGVVSVEIEKECATPMLPSEYTPSDLRMTELFIKGTEPTSVSPRFEKLSSVSDLKSSIDENNVTLTWNKVDTPKINDRDYLSDMYSKLFSDQGYLNSFINSRIAYNNSHLGSIVYNIYEQVGTDLKLIDSTGTNQYTIKNVTGGNRIYVVKTTYSIFKSNMSDGKNIEVKISANMEDEDPIINPGDNEKPNPNDNTDNNENNTENN